MFLSSEALTCDLPAPTPQSVAESARLFTLGASVQVWENETFFSNTIRALLFYNPVVDPHIDSVQGCTQSVVETRGVEGCNIGDIITIHGVNFISSPTTQVQVLDANEIFICSPIKILSSTAMSCILPYTPRVEVNSVLPLRVWNMNGRASNWLIGIDYNNIIPSSAAANTDDRTPLLISVIVCAAIVVLLSIIVMFQWWRRQRGKHEPFGIWRTNTVRREETGLQMGQRSDES